MARSASVVKALDGGLTASADFTPTAAAYGAGDIMDIARELVFVDRSGIQLPRGSLIRILTSVMKIGITGVPSGQTNYILHLYTVTPPSAQADNAAWTLASGDLASYAGAVGLGTPADLGDALYVKTQFLDLDLRLTEVSVFGRLVTVGAHTATAVARSIRLHAVPL